MEKLTQKLTHVQLVEKLRTEKGWILTGGEDVGFVSRVGLKIEPNITSADCNGNVLKIEIPNRIIEVASDNIVLVTPWMIQVFRWYPRHYQKKAKDGGGWHDVMKEFAAVRLRNPQLQSELSKLAKQKEV